MPLHCLHKDNNSWEWGLVSSPLTLPAKLTCLHKIFKQQTNSKTHQYYNINTHTHTHTHTHIHKHTILVEESKDRAVVSGYWLSAAVPTLLWEMIQLLLNTLSACTRQLAIFNHIQHSTCSTTHLASEDVAKLIPSGCGFGNAAMKSRVIGWNNLMVPPEHPHITCSSLARRQCALPPFTLMHFCRCLLLLKRHNNPDLVNV